MHFDLGWSIQDAASLNFQFMEPDPNQIETVSMAQFFNMDKTEFSWDNKNNPFIVNGNEQVFEIHTHFLDSSNVILCIHRDRNYEKNDKEVVIYIVDGGINKNIVHYLADAEDTAEKGFYVFNSMERQ